MVSKDDFNQEIKEKINDVVMYNQNKFAALAKYTGGQIIYKREIYIQRAQQYAGQAICDIIEMAKAYKVLKEMETEESFVDICETRLGVSKTTGYRWAKVAEAFGEYSRNEILKIGTSEVSKLQIIATAPAEEIYHLLSDGTFYGEDKEEIVKMSARELAEFMAQHKHQRHLNDALEKELHKKDIRIREKEIENRELRDQIAALKNDDPRLQVPEEVMQVIDKISAAEFALTNLYNYFNENIHNLPEGKVFEDMVKSRYTRFVALTDRIIEIMKKVAFRRGFPKYDISDLIPEDVEPPINSEPN